MHKDWTRAQSVRFEHLGQAVIFLQEAMSAGNEPERMKDKITDAVDHLQASQYHIAAKDSKISERIRALKKQVQKPLFGMPFTNADGEQEIREIREIREQVHKLFPRAVSASEAHKLAHGDCPTCKVKALTVRQPNGFEVDGKQHVAKGKIVWDEPVPDEIGRFKEIELHNPREITSKQGINNAQAQSKGRFKMPDQAYAVLGTTAGNAAIQIGLPFVDVQMGRAAMQPHLRPSTYINLIGGGAAFYFGMQKGLSNTEGLALTVLGAAMLSKVVGYVYEYVRAAPTKYVGAGYSGPFPTAITPMSAGFSVGQRFS